MQYTRQTCRQRCQCWHKTRTSKFERCPLLPHGTPFQFVQCQQRNPFPSQGQLLPTNVECEVEFSPLGGVFEQVVKNTYVCSYRVRKNELFCSSIASEMDI